MRVKRKDRIKSHIREGGIDNSIIIGEAGETRVQRGVTIRIPAFGNERQVTTLVFTFIEAHEISGKQTCVSLTAIAIVATDVSSVDHHTP